MDPYSAAPAVAEVLARASSQDTSLLKPAEEQLKQWETQSGFYSTLMSVLNNQSLPVNVRWLAVLYFKNGVDRYWRRMAPNSLSEEEKTFLKQQLISSFAEPVSQIATQQSVLIAKVARLDCPQTWPELIPTLLEVIKSDTPLIQQRALLTLHHVIKALASKRLIPDKKAFQELTVNVFGFILMLWNSHTDNFFLSLRSQQLPEAQVFLDHSILALKVLRKLIVFGFKDPKEHQEALSTINLVFQRIEVFIKARGEMSRKQEMQDKREKVINILLKLLLDFQEHHPVTFVQFIKQSLEFIVRFNFTDEGKGLVFEQFQVNLFNVMRSILRCEMYRPAKHTPETKNPLSLEAAHIKSEFFTQDALTEICRRLVLHYFVLSTTDLQTWDTDPEEFIGEDVGDSWKYSLKPCTENLYLTLMKEYRSLVTPVILNLMREFQAPADPDNLTEILKKDAVLTATGLASFDLFDDVDFDQWLTSSLLVELQNKHPNYRILRRRIIWLIGCWVGVKLSSSLRPTLYQTLLPFLGQTEDLVVRLETAITLRFTVDDFDFKTEDFSPYLDSYFGALYQLLKDVSECETKMQVLHVMSFIIERMRWEIRPYAGALIAYLPSLWDESADHNLLRCAILTTLTNLVWGLGEVCATMYEFLLPVIQLSTDVTGEQHVYLYEDGTELWLATLESSPCITEGLLQLYTNMPALLELGGESLQVCLKILEAYIVLGPSEFIQKYGDQLISSLMSLMTDLKGEGVILVFKVVDVMLTACQNEGPQIISRILPDVLKSVIDEKELPMVVSMKLVVLSRVILQNQPFFLELIKQMAAQWGIQSPDDLFLQLLDAWLDKLENLIETPHRKLVSLAFVSLLVTGQPVVLQRFAGLIYALVESLHDVSRVDQGGQAAELDSLVIGNKNGDHNDDSGEPVNTEHEKRMLRLHQSDPVYNISLPKYTMESLTSLQQNLGAETFNKLMDSVDSEIVDQLKQFMR